ncbi:aminodeoxychorismate synthase component I [Lottiidibacillus patelloidae]|uniref:Aminodeoxychorismate synthase component I n=1 Tax=Lottiidibacillus patelloidae TaxID=2670334 RepID=A0A263BQ44_9BACI|nr:anthranilate synthase component I family protein [Lottiidibacillus patelloidae]OZM55871.1 aminodeoxychorismate synthase component I [Lottiidibacillus patelloidae]
MLARKETHHVILESLLGGRYSIIGLQPFAIATGYEKSLQINVGGIEETYHGDPLEQLKQWMEPYRTAVIEDLPDFQGGAIGYISYDYVRQIEVLPEQSRDDLQMPEIYFLIFNDVIVYDHQEEALWLITHSQERSEQEAEKRLIKLEKAVQSEFSEESWKKRSNVGLEKKFSLTEDAFKNAVERIQNYISAGDVFQVNLSVRQAEELNTEPLHIYEKLRELNPSPYMGYFHVPEFQLVSGSPELLIKKKGDTLSTRPIAGTRSRGKNAQEDELLAKELIENEKERAEHVMLVDLERNDLGRVSKFGTVEVNEFMTIEKYSHVMHIVSNVRGLLAKQYDGYDAIRAAFPGGTITGAPKVRTMEIIEELEPVRRGIYTGSIGWLGFNGDLELNIAIRTMVAKDNIAYVQAGAGIVIDSNPAAEYKESLKKAKALWKAKELSEQEVSVNDINDR